MEGLIHHCVYRPVGMLSVGSVNVNPQPLLVSRHHQGRFDTMNHYERARSAINQLEQQQVEIQRRFEEEQQKLADLLQRKQAELEEKQQQVMARLERE